MRSLHRLGLVMALLASSLLGGCTLGKPIVGALTAPVLVFSDTPVFLGCNEDAQQAACCLFAAVAIAGAIGGLVTGIISDVQYLTGEVDDPFENWWHPFATSTSSR
jgi:hypothetical protein